MSTWSDLSSTALDSIFAIGGEEIFYSRVASLGSDRVTEFSTTAIPDTADAVNGNNSTERVFQVRISSIPGGPKKGDRIRYGTETYFVQEILSRVEEDDTANLGLRLAPQ